MFAYAGVDVSKLRFAVYECSSISTLEWLWNNSNWGKKDRDGRVLDQALFCSELRERTNSSCSRWAREVKQCEWDEKTITVAADKGNLEMLKYCFSNDCPCDKRASCIQAAAGGNFDCLRFLFDKVKPSRDTEKDAALLAAGNGSHRHLEIFR